MNVATILEAAKNSTTNTAVLSELENIGWAAGYAEPGYTDPARGGICFANWNDRDGDKTLSRVAKLLECAGAEVEWSDEWANCEDCGRAVRTSPDSYGWTPSYVTLNECALVCRDCVDREQYLAEIEGNERVAATFIDPADHGYILLADGYETGFHPHQNDSPATVARELRARGITRFVFAITGVGQFDAHWAVYVHATQQPTD